MDLDRFVEAVRCAATLHHDQPRKGTKAPYLCHLLSVAGLVLEHGGGEEQAIAALLHDALEDQPGRTSYGEIRERFGQTVADIVRGCTADSSNTDWKSRKEAYVAHLAKAPEDVCLVAAADKLHNARAILRDYRTLDEALWARFDVPTGQTDVLWYYRELAAARRGRPPAALTDEFTRVVDELHRVSGHPPR